MKKLSTVGLSYLPLAGLAIGIPLDRQACS